MVYLIVGKQNSGKTTLAYHLKEILESYGESVIVLDGDEIRKYFPLGYSEPERRKRTFVIGKLAAMFEEQGVVPIIALLSEKKEWRECIRKLFENSRLIYLPGGNGPKGVIYEVPEPEEIGEYPLFRD